jgi:hypothetical protein
MWALVGRSVVAGIETVAVEPGTPLTVVGQRVKRMDRAPTW